eukprot:jgi/Mesvir1/19837/Mv13127-RA.1
MGTPLSEAYTFSPSGEDTRVPMATPMHPSSDTPPFQETMAPNPRGSLSAPLAPSHMRRPPQAAAPGPQAHQGPSPAEIHAARMRQQALMDCRIRQIAGEEARSNAIKYIVAGGVIAAIAFYLLNKRWETKSIASRLPDAMLSAAPRP